ncbi:hypothetical protein M3Y99_01400000 [Aphelenchoides fujianensis]|nr:hypothetical protein M3Y99_01400000 [Aphelenchoides fujianensis]
MDESSRKVRNVEIDPHATDAAIVLRYDLVDGQKTTKKSKIIQLKNFSDELEPLNLARSVIDQCPLIPSARIHDLEQVLFYLQRRLSNKHAVFGVSNGVNAMASRAEIFQLEEYIEMLYEDSEKLKASSLILSLALRLSNLKTIAENDVLVGALTRVLREDSRKNFELATNLASIFVQLSMFTRFHSLLSHFKIGALSLQLIENELKRHDLWTEQMTQNLAGDQRRKWELAIKKQELFLVECFKILINLSVETKTEVKMIKRGLLSSLVKCLEHNKSPVLLKTAILFLWKLSVFVENKDAMSQMGAVEKIVELLPSSDSEMANIIFALLFNLSFDSQLRGRMVNAGLMNYVASHISSNEVALALLYQLSVVDDAKGDVHVHGLHFRARLVGQIPTGLAGRQGDPRERVDGEAERSTDLRGRRKRVGFSAQTGDRKRRLAAHEGRKEHFVARGRHSRAFRSVDRPAARFDPKLHLVADGRLSGRCARNRLRPAAQPMAVGGEIRPTDRVDSNDPQELEREGHQVLPGRIPAPHRRPVRHVGGGRRMCALAASPLIDDIIKLLNRKQEDDEFVLQIAFCFARMIVHPDLIKTICRDHKQLLEYLINMSHDKNVQLCAICDQALQLVSEIDEFWFKRIAEERFCWHNAQWLDVVEGGGNAAQEFSDDEEESFLSEQFRNAVFGADEILGSEKSFRSNPTRSFSSSPLDFHSILLLSR